jgi:uncharacterized protein YwgA
MERFQWLAAIVAAHKDHKVIGRTRLQKTVKLLQRLGAPLDFSYKLHHYGPYSEDLQSEIGLLENIGLITENQSTSSDGTTYYTLEANPIALDLINKPEFEPFQAYIDTINKIDPVILELAATYDAYKEAGSDDSDAMNRLREKKGAKCYDGKAEKAIELLREIGL